MREMLSFQNSADADVNKINQLFYKIKIYYRLSWNLNNMRLYSQGCFRDIHFCVHLKLNFIILT